MSFTQQTTAQPCPGIGLQSILGFCLNRTVLKLLCLILVCLTSQPIFAQNERDDKIRLDNGRVLMDQGKYELAMRELQPLTQNLTVYAATGIAPDAAYLYSVAAYRAGKTTEAEQMLGKLKKGQPSWPGMPEANYLQATIAFEQGKYEQAIQLLSDNNNPALAADIEKLKRFHLKKINKRPVIAGLAQKYPRDAEVGAAYASLIKATYTPADKALLDQLISTYKLNPQLYKPTSAAAFKPAYRVGILFPFGLEAGGGKKNQFVIDLYEGIRYAADSMAKSGGSRIDLFTYETSADTNNLKRVLQMPELATMDLIIGPVYKSGSRIITRFANQHRIPVINPLSEDGELLQASNYLYLFESSLQTKAKQLSRFAYTNFSPPAAFVIYENRKEDSTLAALYKQEFEKLGGQVVSFKKVHSVNKSYNTAFFSALDVTQAGHIAIFSATPNVAANFLSMLDSKNIAQAVLAPGAWLEIGQLPLEELDAREIYFIAPHQTDPKSPGLLRFQRGYRHRTHLPPSTYSNTGFDLMWHFGHALQQYGTAFGPALAAAGYRPGALYSGFDYSQSNDNSFVPLFKMENLQLMQANSASDPTNLLPPPPPDEKPTQPIKK